MKAMRLDYGGLLEPWKVNLILARARRMGFRSDELEDVQQEVVLDLLSFRYDPAKSNGAKESSVLVLIIDRRLRNMKRATDRYLRHIKRASVPTECDDLSRVEVLLDVQEAMASLPAREQEVCRALCEGLSTCQVAGRLGWSWRRVNRTVVSIAEEFSRLGLGGN